MSKEANSTERALKLALEALGQCASHNCELESKAITALREALAKPDFWEGYVPEPVKPRGEATLAQQEPVAVHQFRKRGCSDWYDGYPDHTDGRGPYQARTLYTSPPAQQEAQAEETVKERTPQERRDAGEWHCPECFTFGHQHRRGCTATHGIKENT